MSLVKEDGRERAMSASMRATRIRLFLLRHGQVIGHDELRFHGDTDVGLTDVGKHQLKTAAEQLKNEPIDEVFCSDLQRSVFGANEIARSRSLDPIQNKGLREMHMGLLEGRTYKEVQGEHGDVFKKWRDDLLNFRLPGGETFSEVKTRVENSMRSIMNNKKGKNIAIVAHGGVNRIILADALKMDPAYAFRIEQDFGCLNVIDYYPDWTVVKLMNRSF